MNNCTFVGVYFNDNNYVMKNVILIQGKKKSGRTTIMRKLADLLQMENVKTEKLDKDEMSIVGGYRGTKVGMLTFGDYDDAYWNTLSALYEECDLIVATCNEYKNTKGANDYVFYAPEHEGKLKRVYLNTPDCNELLDEVACTCDFKDKLYDRVNAAYAVNLKAVVDFLIELNSVES